MEKEMFTHIKDKETIGIYDDLPDCSDKEFKENLYEIGWSLRRDNNEDCEDIFELIDDLGRDSGIRLCHWSYGYYLTVTGMKESLACICFYLKDCSYELIRDDEKKALCIRGDTNDALFVLLKEQKEE